MHARADYPPPPHPNAIHTSNSVKMSGFPHSVKQKWLGEFYFLGSTCGNEPGKSHVGHVRVAYRYEIYHDEFHFLERVADRVGTAWLRRAIPTMKEEDAIILRMCGLTRDELRRRKSWLVAQVACGRERAPPRRCLAVGCRSPAHGWRSAGGCHSVADVDRVSCQ